MAKGLTTKEFIKRAKLVHGNTYDYSKTIYINQRTNVTIICKSHGEFLQKGGNHLSGMCGCKLCNTNVKLTTKEFIERAVILHGDTYDYSRVEYVNNRTDVEIICKIHGSFKQSPEVHLRPNGCKICSGNDRVTIESFIKCANDIHDYKYGYELITTEFKSNKDVVSIICPIHGVFNQPANRHLINKSGCGKCSNTVKSNTTEFIEKSTKVHGDKYDYSKSNYISALEKLDIICKKHGIFSQKPNSHLNGSGCRKCANENHVGSYNKGNIRNWGHTQGYFYIISLINIDTNEAFYKYGISKQPKIRFGSYGKYKLLEILECSKMKLSEAFKLECDMKLKTINYLPKIKFGGYTECFKLYDLEQKDN